VGVQRQYTCTAGRIENSQVAVFLTYAATRGHSLIDTRLYLPKSWVEDPGRCRAAGVPDDIEFATKPKLAQAMITDALDAGVLASWGDWRRSLWSGLLHCAAPAVTTVSITEPRPGSACSAGGLPRGDAFAFNVVRR
jgi:hypothetical protein